MDTNADARRRDVRHRRPIIVGLALLLLIVAAVVTTFTGLPPYRYAKGDLEDLRDRLNTANASCPAFPGRASVDLIRSRVVIPVRAGEVSTNIPATTRLSKSDEHMIGGSHMFVPVVCSTGG